jgi:hypothetical protein
VDNVRVYLFAALVPPRTAVDDLWNVVEMTTASLTTGANAGRHSGRPRLRLRKAQEAEPAPPSIVLEPAAHVNVPIAKFGNLTLADATRLVDSMTSEAAGWAAPRLRLSGYATGDSEEDPTVWVELTGDLDELGTITRGVPTIAQGLRIFVDRRGFRPRVKLGRITEHATVPYVEALLDTIDHFDGDAWWQTELALLTHAEQGPDQPSFKTYASIPLGPEVPH